MAFHTSNDRGDVRRNIGAQVLQLLNLVLNFLDHRIDLLGKLRHLQDILNQDGRVQDDVEQEGIGRPRREEQRCRTRDKEQDDRKPTIPPRMLRSCLLRHRIQR